MRTAEELNRLKDQDIYSLILFSLFKIRDIPEYAALSELVYILDKQSLLKLCEYFGGMTLKIPTIEELESIVYTLVLYQFVDIEKIEYNEAIKMLGCSNEMMKKVKHNYKHLSKILDKYDFGARNNND